MTNLESSKTRIVIPAYAGISVNKKIPAYAGMTRYLMTTKQKAMFKKIINLFSRKPTRFPCVVVGKIIDIAKHPNATRLQLTKVDVGAKILAIVCGDPNIKVGQLVPVALIGAKLPNGIIIKEVELRGEPSFGMLCAPDELGLGESHAGVLSLRKDAVPGKTIDKWLS